MKRSVLVLVAMVAVVAIILWAGERNLRERRASMQAQEQRQAAMMSDMKMAPGDEPMDTKGGPADELSPLKDKPAPAFTLSDLNGRKVSLSDFKGKPLVVNFWATWCGPCKVEMPWFQEFTKKYASDGFEVLGVADDADAGNAVISGTAKKLGVTYPILLADDTVEKAYGDPEMLPISFYVDRAGKVTEVTAGLGSKDQMEANIKATVNAGVSQ